MRGTRERLTPTESLLTCGVAEEATTEAADGILRLESDFDLNEGTEEMEEKESANDRTRALSRLSPPPWQDGDSVEL